MTQRPTLEEPDQTRPRVAMACWQLGRTSETFIRTIADRLPLELKSFELNEAKQQQATRGKRLLKSLLFAKSPEPDRFVHFIGDHRFDLAYIHTGPLARRLSGACKDRRLNFVVHFHGVDAYSPEYTGSNGEAYTEIFKDAAAIVGVSRHMCSQLRALGCPESKIHYVPYYVDPLTFTSVDPESKPPHLLAVGRFVEKKAPIATLAAFKRALAEVPDAHLHMIGDGPMLAACKQFAKAENFSNSVTFLGEQPHTAVAGLMDQVRAFVQHSVVASDNDHEGTPVAIIEAQISGLPVVSTYHAGIPDVVVNEKTGFLVDEYDIETMATRMVELAKNAALAKAMGIQAREHSTSLLSFEATIGKLASILNAQCAPTSAS